MDTKTPRVRKSFQPFVAESSADFNRRRDTESSSAKKGKDKPTQLKGKSKASAGSKSGTNSGDEKKYHHLKQSALFQLDGKLYKVASGKCEVKSKTWVSTLH